MATATRRLAAQTSPDGATEEWRAEPQRPARVHLPKSKPAASAGLQQQVAGAKATGVSGGFQGATDAHPGGGGRAERRQRYAAEVRGRRKVEAEAAATRAKEVAALQGRQRSRRRARVGHGQATSARRRGKVPRAQPIRRAIGGRPGRRGLVRGQAAYVGHSVKALAQDDARAATHLGPSPMVDNTPRASAPEAPVAIGSSAASVCGCASFCC